MSSIITAHDISWEQPNGNILFKHLSFSISPGLTALVGPNGFGKSTLAKLLAKKLQPSTGSLQTEASIYLLEQSEKAANITLLEYLGLDYSWTRLGEQLLNQLDLSWSCSHLSGGQWMKVRLAKALQHPFLILDEPTNNLDREGKNILIHFLKNFEGSILLISHDRECLSLCDDILELSNQGISKYGAGWANYESAREKERSLLNKNLEVAEKEKSLALQKRQQELLKQEKRNRQASKASKNSGLPKILLGKRKRNAEETSGKVDEKTLTKTNEAIDHARQALNELKVDPIMYADLLTETIPSQKLVTEAIDFNLKFTEDENWLFKQNLNFCWRGPIRINLKGKNGSGKSTLIKAILVRSKEKDLPLISQTETQFLNSIPFTTGSLKVGDLKILYVDQNYSSLNHSLSIIDNIKNHTVLSDNDIRNKLAKFLFTQDSVFQTVDSLSGGEKLRAALSLGLLQIEKPELIILDEPTNNLDLKNIEFLEKIICDYKGALIVISHDDVFLENCHLTDVLNLDNL